MNPGLLVNQFHRISDAPDAIPRLRSFILELAVRGKLVEQDPKDEPASGLLHRIQAEKARLAKVGEIKKQRPLPPIERGEAPFSAPPGWEWTRIRQVTSDRGQTIPDKDFTYIDVTAINKEGGYVADPTILAPADAPSRARKVVHTGDVLYSCVRPYLLNVAVIQNEIIPAPVASTAFAVLNGFGLVLSKYLWIALRSPFMVECVEAKMRGQAYPAINDSDFATLPLPLPPLAEQHRIVAKVDELMGLCDRLEAAQREREARCARLASASHYYLTNRADAEMFRGYANFCLSNFPCLTSHSGQIKQLRQTILNLAIRGQLTNKSDELPTGTPSRDATFSGLDIRLPAHWSIQPLTKVASAIVDCPHSTPKWTSEGKICVRTNQFRPGHLDLTGVRFVSESTYRERIQRLEPAENDILYSREGGILGVACRVPPNTQLCLGQRMMLIRAGAALDAAFLEMVMNSPLITGIALAKTTGGAAPRINVSTVKAYPIPLPPLVEQYRIVAKVNELMAVCDRLEMQLTTAQADTSRLLESVLHNALVVTSLRDFPSGNPERNMIEVPEKQLTAVLRKQT
jgi:type I restriction enzyme S subunit